MSYSNHPCAMRQTPIIPSDIKRRIVCFIRADCSSGVVHAVYVVILFLACEMEELHFVQGTAKPCGSSAHGKHQGPAEVLSVAKHVAKPCDYMWYEDVPFCGGSGKVRSVQRETRRLLVTAKQSSRPTTAFLRWKPRAAKVYDDFQGGQPTTK